MKLKGTNTKIVWLLESIDWPGEYIRYVGGDWGPEFLTTSDPMKAVRCGSRDEALNHRAASKRGWKVKPIKMRFTRSWEFL